MMPSKKIRWIILVLLVVSGSFYLYRSFFAYKTTETGLTYRFLKGNPLEQPLSADNYCLINYKILGPDGDTLVSTYGNDTLVEVPYPVEAKNELTEALRLASPGSRVEILLSTDSLKLKNSSDYRVQLLPNGEKAKVIFDFVRVISNQEYYRYLAEKSFKRTMAENKAIDEFAASHKGRDWHLDSFEMIKYRVLSDTHDLFCNMWLAPNLFGNAPIHKAAEELEFDVVMKRLNGELIHDSRLEYKKYKASATAWLLPTKALNRLPFYVDEGMEVEFLVTSDYGFGAAGRIGVPPYTPLYVKIFNVKVLK
jgi:hypothetical protein